MGFSATLDCDHGLFCSPLVWVYGHRLQADDEPVRRWSRLLAREIRGCRCGAPYDRTTMFSLRAVAVRCSKLLRSTPLPFGKATLAAIPCRQQAGGWRSGRREPTKTSFSIIP